jgi:DNA-binding response OmpR family regulator
MSDNAALPEAPPRYVLVADDDPGICLAMLFTLRKLAIEAGEAHSAAELDAAMASRSPDMIFLDLSLGRAGGTDVIELIGRHRFGGRVQLMSGRSEECLDEVRRLGARQGLDMLPPLTKPFRMSALRALLEPSRTEAG